MKAKFTERSTKPKKIDWALTKFEGNLVFSKAGYFYDVVFAGSQRIYSKQ